MFIQEIIIVYLITFIGYLLFIYLLLKQKTKNKPISITIDGNIGSGKSTLLHLLSKHPTFKNNYVFIPEPVSVWNNFKESDGTTILTNFYNDKKKWGYVFQSMAFITRYISIKNNKNNNIIAERSVYTDRNVFANLLYKEGCINKIEMGIYNYCFNNFNVDIDLFIYLDTSVKNCSKRIISRNRNGEDAINEEYLTSLEKEHINWFNNISNSLFIDGNVDFVDDKNELDRMLNHIYTKINELK